MAAPKAQTIQQRFGFLDNDLKTPKHDEIMLWLDKNAVSIVEELYWKPAWPSGTIETWKARTDIAIADAINRYRETYDKATESARQDEERFTADPTLSYHKDYMERHKREAARHLSLWENLENWPGLGQPPSKPEMPIEEFGWESPVMSDERGKYIIGFIDLKVNYHDWSLRVDSIQEHEGYYPSGKPVSKWRLSGEVHPEWKISEGHNHIVCFEVKTTIPSLGELIRQVNMYKAYQTGRFIVISPDDKFVEPLKSQGIDFYKYDPQRVDF